MSDHQGSGDEQEQQNVLPPLDSDQSGSDGEDDIQSEAASQPGEEETERSLIPDERQTWDSKFRHKNNELLCSLPLWVQEHQFLDYLPSAEDEKLGDDGSTNAKRGLGKGSYRCKRTCHDVPLLFPKERGPFAVVAAWMSGNAQNAEEDESATRDVAFAIRLAFMLVVPPLDGISASRDPTGYPVCVRHYNREGPANEWLLSHFALGTTAFPPQLQPVLSYQSHVMALTCNIPILFGWDECDEWKVPERRIKKRQATLRAEDGSDEDKNSSSSDSNDDDDEEEEEEELRQLNHHKEATACDILGGFIVGAAYAKSRVTMQLLLQFAPKTPHWVKAMRVVMGIDSRVNHPYANTLLSIADNFVRKHQPLTLDTLDADVWERRATPADRDDECLQSDLLASVSDGITQEQIDDPDFELQSAINGGIEAYIAKRWKLVKRIRQENIDMKSTPTFLGFCVSMQGRYLPSLAGRVNFDLRALLNTYHMITSRMPLGSTVRIPSAEDDTLERMGSESRSDLLSHVDIAVRCIELLPEVGESWMMLGFHMQSTESVRLDDGRGAGRQTYSKLDAASRAAELEIKEVGPDGDPTLPLNNLACTMPKDSDQHATLNGVEYTKFELCVYTLEKCFEIGMERCDVGAEYIWDTMGGVLEPGETFKTSKYKAPAAEQPFVPTSSDDDDKDEESEGWATASDDDSDGAGSQPEENDRTAKKTPGSATRGADERKDPTFDPQVHEFTAVKCFLEALKFNPSHPVLWLHLGLALWAEAKFVATKGQRHQDPMASGMKATPSVKLPPVLFSVPLGRMIHTGDEALQLALQAQSEVDPEDLPEGSVVATSEFGTAQSAEAANAEVGAVLGPVAAQLPQTFYFDEATCFQVALCLDEEGLITELITEGCPEAVNRFVELVGPMISVHGKRLIGSHLGREL